MAFNFRGGSYSGNGSVTEFGNYLILQLTGNGTLTLTRKIKLSPENFLIIGGGGGGGGNDGGGGGAGEVLRNNTVIELAADDYGATIGAGGNRGANNTAPARGGLTTFGTWSAYGGGRGGEIFVGYYSGSTGGSAGGSCYAEPVPISPTSHTYAEFDSLVSGSVFQNIPDYSGAGGGGAISLPVGQNGGNGLASYITGQLVNYAWGGGGGGQNGRGTSQGGGNGAHGGHLSGSNAVTPGSGGGGGGNDCTGCSGDWYGGNGASGIVILRFLNVLTVTIGGTKALLPPCK